MEDSNLVNVSAKVHNSNNKCFNDFYLSTSLNCRDESLETSMKRNVEFPPFCAVGGWSRGDAAHMYFHIIRTEAEQCSDWIYIPGFRGLLRPSSLTKKRTWCILHFIP